MRSAVHGPCCKGADPTLRVCARRSLCRCQQSTTLPPNLSGLTLRAVRAQVTGLPVSGFFYMQHLGYSTTSGAGNTLPGGGQRRLLEFNQNAMRALLQSNTTTADAEAASTAAAANALLASNSGRKLLQKFSTTNGLQISYACAP